MPINEGNRRRFANLDERRQLYEIAAGRCQRCSEPLGDDWQAAHLVSWVHHGPTRMGNLAAWCKKCNLAQGPEDAVPGVILRPWQAEALTAIVEQIYDTGVATIHAAPGAGKTIFAAAVFRRLKEVGAVDRMVVVVPNTALRSQWVDSLATVVSLDDSPRDGWLEHRDDQGAVVSYQGLPNTAGAHQTELTNRATLVVLDEVHHVGEPGHTAWGKAVAKMVGDVKTGVIHPAAVLNMTGTLFRSKGGQRISTVRYQPAADDPAKIEAIADYSVFTRDLIPHTLRPPYVYTYGTHVELLDMSTAEVIEGDIADLDRSQQSAVLRESFSQRSYVEGFAAEAVRLLGLQQTAIGPDEPLKLLCVTSDQRAARRFADAFNQVTGQDFARLVISDEPDSLKTLRHAARERRSLAIVSVRMVTEGFDCPALSTIAYASNVTADLSIAQTMARAMRITDAERRVGKIVPAQFLIPDHADLKAAFAQALTRQMHVLNADEATKIIDGAGGDWIRPLGPRFEVLDLSEPVLRGADVLVSDDGHVEAFELSDWEAQLAAVGVPAVYAPGIIVASRSVFPRVYSRGDTDDREAAPTKPATGRQMNQAHRRHIDRLARWMAVHLSHDGRWNNIQAFQAIANEEAGVPKGERDIASQAQLARIEVWMTARVMEHCRTHNEVLPVWVANREGDK